MISLSSILQSEAIAVGAARLFTLCTSSIAPEIMLSVDSIAVTPRFTQVVCEWNSWISFVAGKYVALRAQIQNQCQSFFDL